MSRAWRYRTLLLALALFAVGVVFSNPWRDMAMDDDWAYARVVRTLMQTGRYSLDAWLSPHMPVQAAYGAVASALFGYNFATLRVASLVLMPLGLLGLYALARGHGFDRDTSGVLALVFAASPIPAYSAYSFNTDSPALMLTVCALAAYTHALKDRAQARRALLLMLLGSGCAALAILTRQSALVLLAALGIVWLIDGQRWPSRWLYAAGALLPTLAVGVQIALATAPPNWSAQHTVLLQAAHFRDPLRLAGETVWRIAAGLVYTAAYCAPLAIFSLAARRGRAWLPVGLAVLLTVGVAIAGGVRADGSGLVPYFPWFALDGDLVRLSLSLGMLLAGALLLPSLVRRIGVVRQLAPHLLLIDVAAVGSALLLLAFFKLLDRYLIVLIPFVIIAVAHALRPALAQRWRWVALAAIVLWGCSTLSTRALLEENEARWRLADQVAASGVARSDIAISMPWSQYHGAFDAYIAVYPPEVGSYDAFFDDWAAGLMSGAHWTVVSREADDPARAAFSVPYSGVWGQPRRMDAISPADRALTPSGSPDAAAASTPPQ